MCMSVFVYVHVYMHHVTWYPEKPERESNFLKLELQAVVSPNVDAGNQTYSSSVRAASASNHGTISPAKFPLTSTYTLIIMLRQWERPT